MNSLREQIEILLTEYAGQVHCEVADEYETAGDILALIAEAMLSEEAVDAGARAITSDPNFGYNTWADDARNVITDALAAAGITPGDAREGD